MRRRLPLLAALTALLMLAASLLPGLHALARAQHSAAQWVEVCSAQGSRWIAISGEAAPDQAPAAPTDHLALQHCPLCLWQAQALALPPAPPTHLDTAPALSHAPPQGRGAKPVPAQRWAAAQPRGPPATSSC